MEIITRECINDNRGGEETMLENDDFKAGEMFMLARVKQLTEGTAEQIAIKLLRFIMKEEDTNNGNTVVFMDEGRENGNDK